MKINQLFAVLVSVFVAQSMFAAQVTVYNKTNDADLGVVIVDGKNVKKSYQFTGGKPTSYMFDTHLHSVQSIIWQTSSSRYTALIPAWPGMVGGKIEIFDNGRYLINFGPNQNVKNNYAEKI